MSRIYEALQKARKEGRGEAPAPAVKTPVTAPTERKKPRAAMPPGQVSAAMSTLLGAIRPLLDEKPGAVLHFVAATEGEGASTVAREFAAMLAAVGHRRTLLVDADLRSIGTARLFNCPEDLGLIDCQFRQKDYGEAIVRAAVGDLSVALLAATRNAEQIDVKSVRTLYAALRERFDVTVMDCPAISTGDYTSLIPEAADGIILVVEAERVRPAVVAHAKGIVQQAGGNLIGAVLNKRKSYIPNFLYRTL